MIKLLVTGAMALEENQIEELRKLGYEITIHPDERMPVEDPEKYEAVICNGLFLTQESDEFSSLRMIQLTSAGTDRVPVEKIREKEILLHNAEDTYSIPMAEFAVGGILQLYKNTAFFIRNKDRRQWEKDRKLRELSGKRVLILGTGNVGSAIAGRLRAFGCPVTGLSRSGKTNPVFNTTDQIATLEEKIPKADILVLAIPITDETREIMDRSRLDLMKDDAVLVNVSRGKLVDEDALVAWLRDHPKGGAVLDVFEEEPLASDSPLWELPNVVLTPHNSFVGEGNKQRLYQVVKKNLELYACNKQ